VARYQLTYEPSLIRSHSGAFPAETPQNSLLLPIHVLRLDNEKDDHSAEHYPSENKIMGPRLRVADNVQFHFMATVKRFRGQDVLSIDFSRRVLKKHVPLCRAQLAIRGK
jgi:hypothetical protein